MNRAKRQSPMLRKRLKPFTGNFYREVTDDDILKLFEIRMKRIFKFDSDEADKKIQNLEDEISQVKNNIEHIIEYTIAYYERIRTKYGKGRERKTEIRNFENIEAAKVVIATRSYTSTGRKDLSGTP